MLLFIWFFNGFCVYVIMAHIVRHAIDLGITPMRAASILSIIGGASIAGRLLMGRVSDSIGRKRAFMIGALLMAAAMLWLIGSSNLWMLSLCRHFWVLLWMACASVYSTYRRYLWHASYWGDSRSIGGWLGKRRCLWPVFCWSYI